MQLQSGTKIFDGKAAKQHTLSWKPLHVARLPLSGHVQQVQPPHTCHWPVNRFLGSSLVKLGGKSAQGVLLSFGGLGQATFACGCTIHWETENIQLGLLLKLAGKGIHSQQWAPSTLATIV